MLWDIDHTLLYSGGAGTLGMRRAFRDLYGEGESFRAIEHSGRTDWAILVDAAVEFGIDRNAPCRTCRDSSMPTSRTWSRRLVR